MSDLRIVIADDHPIVRDGLEALLSSVPGFTVVGQASNGRLAVREVLLTRPDVVLLDLGMPELDGFEATRQIVRASPGVAVLVLTMHDDDDSVFAAMRAGARGYLLKGAEQEEIIGAIRAVAAGEAIFGPGAATRVLKLLTGGHQVVERPFPELTAREVEILDLLAAGLSNAVIAQRLSIAPKTVANHASGIFSKLSVAGRPEAIVRARDAGLGKL